jgi:hypothetical protein
MLRELNTDWKHIKTYATERALRKRFAEDADLYPAYNDRYMVVRTPEGRWTAIVVLDKAAGGYVGRNPFMKV